MKNKNFSLKECRIKENVLSSICLMDLNKKFIGWDPKKVALQNACIAIDGTVRKRNRDKKDNKWGLEYKKFLREYYWLLEPMSGGIDFKTKWKNLDIYDHKGSLIGEPDIADVIYHIFRCRLCHCESLPENYDLLPTEKGTARCIIADNRLQMSEHIVWALLSASVFSGVNSDIVSEGDYFLSFGNKEHGIKEEKFVIRDYWGQEKEIKKFFSERPQQKIIFENLESFKSKKV